MARVDALATEADCSLISIEVFDHNPGALNLYRRLGFEIIEKRRMIASDYVPAGEVLLLTRRVG